MKKKIMMMLAFMLLTCGAALAQTKISGTVFSQEDGQPIIGAAVRVVDTNVGALTDMNGHFSLNVPAGKKQLQVSFLGYETQTVSARSGLKVFLKQDAQLVDEVVVVAYGTQKRTTLTGSIQEVKAAEIERRPTSSVTSALEGTVSGIQVNSTYGNPGSDPSIRIRGFGSINGSMTPLYILDGTPYEGNISDLNPADIESISVLKDAASAALYGNRASNGVILITTKKGQRGKLHLTLDAKVGTYNKGTREYKRVGARDFMGVAFQNIKNQYMTNKGVDADVAADYAREHTISDYLYLNIFDKADNALFDDNGKLVSDARMIGTYGEDLDWYDQAVRHGQRREYNVNASGANERADYLFSVGYLDENGYLKDSSFDRISARTVVNMQATPWLKVGLNLSGSHQNSNNTNGDSDGSYTNVFMYCRGISPIYPVHLHDINTGQYLLDGNGQLQYDGGSYFDEDGQVVVTRNQYADRHLMWENELNYDKTTRNTLNGTAYADILLPYNFTFTVKGNLNTRHTENYTYSNSVIGDGKGNNGRAKRINYRYKIYTVQEQLRWNHDYGKHSVDALLGHENYYYNYNYLYGYKTSEVFFGSGNMRNFTEITSLYDYDNNYRTESYLARARYSYDERYNAEVSFRRDGSSRFAKDSRWGNFWSIGANWIVSKEKFMKDIKWVDFLKLRADYGEVGNDAGSGLYGYMALYAATQNANKGAYYISQLPNEDLKWETGQSWGIGVDARLWKRVNVSLEYFDKRNKELLFDVYNPLSAGATSTSYAESVTTKNMGTIANRGWEFSADADVYKNKDWKVNVGVSFTKLKNKVLKLPEQLQDGYVDGSKKIMEGKDRYAFYVYTWEGINMANGRSLYKFNDEDYYFNVLDADGNVTATYGDPESGTEMEADNMQHIVIIDGKAYSYKTSYAKKEFHGSAIPKLYGSFNLNVSWKQLSLGALFTYQLGGKVLDSNYQDLMMLGGTPSAVHSDILRAWDTTQATVTVDADGNEMPLDQVNPCGIPAVNYDQNSDNNATSSRWLTSASYLVLKNLSLSYQLPKSLISPLHIEGVGVSLSCENLFTLTKRQGMNPQQTFNGTQYNYLVTPRVISFGLNVKF